MKDQVLCLGVSESFCKDVYEQIKCFRSAGFEGFFTGWNRELDVSKIKKLADEMGMFYQSIHAPFSLAADMWKGGEASLAAENELISCLRSCAENNVEIMVAHAFIGFDDHTPTPEGIESFSRVVFEAEKLGVSIALENTEGEEYLAALMEVFKSSKAVGFCFDSGHELCYNGGKDMLELYGDRLIATHINDNLGVSDLYGRITWKDDLHLLPFDGIVDFKGIAERLHKYNYNGPLTFELTRLSKPDRHDNDKYMRMITDEYIAEAYARACRFASMKKQSSQG
ncbi:MAG: sugar phosphate isomerase/epimerase [Clostridia bacterium]|nr:sugar phosphate isomerase/epimerase [Clostridia bacterium]